MDPSEMLGLLGLGDAPAEVPEAAEPESATVALRHPTAVKCDEWALRRGRELADCPRWEATGLDALAAADFHALAFDPRPELQECDDAARGEFVRALVETPEYHALHADTMLDDYGAQIAALHLGDKFAEHKRKSEAARPGKPGDGEIATMVAAAEAVAAAAEEVREVKEAAEALGGMGAGGAGKKLDPAKVAEAYKRVRNNPRLRAICNAAGRYRRVAQSKQRMKSVHGQDETVGVELGGDLSRILPAELVKLDVPELELDMLRRIAERQAQCRELGGVEPVGKGPIIVVVDESGSMDGEKIIQAKALALGLAWVARSQGRWCALVAYSGGSGERLLALPPGRWDELALCEWLAEFISYGSDLDVPIFEMPGYYAALGAPRGKTDVLFITDAVCVIPADGVASFNAWKREVGAKVSGLIVGSRAGDLVKVCEECHEVGGVDAGNASIGKILS